MISTKEVIEWEVEQYIQIKMFPKIKFIVNDMMMNYSAEKNSLCQIILTGINCAVENGQLFWNTYKNTVFNLLKICQSNATAAIKMGYHGECNQKC